MAEESIPHPTLLELHETYYGAIMNVIRNTLHVGPRDEAAKPILAEIYGETFRRMGDALLDENRDIKHPRAYICGIAHHLSVDYIRGDLPFVRHSDFGYEKNDDGTFKTEEQWLSEKAEKTTAPRVRFWRLISRFIEPAHKNFNRTAKGKVRHAFYTALKYNFELEGLEEEYSIKEWKAFKRNLSRAFILWSDLLAVEVECFANSLPEELRCDKLLAIEAAGYLRAIKSSKGGAEKIVLMADRIWPLDEE